ncbi:MAG: sugar ABC transporter ATP-binding protein [Planctomycetes bacterium]|nr:sugar ABC transporter ATP-binding protein [Planctomycetota bacterium]MCD7897625.1 sugar ABC transporter ATP-binding protein [Planctomycetaceae bacterium]
MTDSNYVLEMLNIVKTFPGVRALDNMSLRVRPGTVHALVGENGAGKSTLMKILSGQYAIDEGRIFFQGRELHPQNAADALNAGISMIHQELSPINDMTIAENVFLGREPMRAGGWMVDFPKMYRDTERLFDKLGVTYNPRARMGTLSVAGMQLVEIAKAISREASLIIMDEPTSAITETEVEILFRQINELRSNGVAIVYITHKMDEIFAIADDITIIRDGSFISTGAVADFDSQKLISMMVGRTITEIFPKTAVPIGKEIIRLENLSGKGFSDVSFTVRAGEIVGLAGLVGAGRTEIARAIFGLDAARSGKIFVEGEEVHIGTVRDSIRRGIAMISEDRKQEGLVLQRSVKENTSLAYLKQFSSRLKIDGKTERERVREMIQLLQVKTSSMDTQVSTLSGGNQQKVVIAKWILGDVKVLILDEPTRGIDVGSKSEIHRLMGRLAQQGMAIIMISSELPEVLGMSDRIVVMHEGRMKGIIAREEATQETIMHMAVSEPTAS